MEGSSPEDEPVHLHPYPQPIQFATHEIEARETKSGRRRFISRPLHERPGNSVLICMPICFLSRKHMPDDHKQFASNRYDGFFLPNARGEPLKLLLPIGMMLNGHPGGFDQGCPHFLSPLLGDMSRLIRLSRGVDTCSPASIPD